MDILKTKTRQNDTICRIWEGQRHGSPSMNLCQTCMNMCAHMNVCVGLSVYMFFGKLPTLIRRTTSELQTKKIHYEPP